jgi:hypothetical protein
MKVLIDTDNKYFSILDPVTIPDLTEFVNKHGFGDYIMRFEDEIHIPSNWEIKPPFYPTCETTSTPVSPDDDTKVISRKKYIGVDILTLSNGAEFAIANFDL